MKDTFTLRELRALVHPTHGKPLPTAKSLRESDSMVVASTAIGEDGALCVYESGFFLYQASGRTTVGAVDRCGDYAYDGGDRLEEAVFEEAEWTVRLVLEGEARLEHNNEKRHGNAYSYSADVMEADDLRDAFDLEAMVTEQDEWQRALECLTEKQRKVVELRFFDGLNQAATAKRLSITHQAVDYLEKAAKKRIQKYFY